VRKPAAVTVAVTRESAAAGLRDLPGGGSAAGVVGGAGPPARSAPTEL
jgi:hypothetical protein